MADDEDFDASYNEQAMNQILQEQLEESLRTLRQHIRDIYGEPAEEKKAKECQRAALDADFDAWMERRGGVEPKSFSSDDEDDEEIDMYDSERPQEISSKNTEVKRATDDGTKIVVSFLEGYGTKSKPGAKSVVPWLIENDQNSNDHHYFYYLKDTANKLGRRLTRGFLNLFLIVSKTAPVLAVMLKDYASSLLGFVGATTMAILNQAILEDEKSKQQGVSVKVLNMDVEEIRKKIKEMFAA